MRKQNKKVLLIGGGIGQLYLAEKLHEEEIDFIIIAYNVSKELRALAQKVILHDLFDLEGVLAIAKEEKIDAVISDQTDIYIPTVAYVAEHLNLPGNTYGQVISYCDKNRFRDICDRLNVPVPRHVELKSISNYYYENPPFAFPIMIKPADMQASVGVVKVDNIIDYKEGIVGALNLSKSNSVIIEEYFVGHEVVCEGLIQDGMYFNLNFADRVYFDLPDLFIPSQTIFPSAISVEVKRRIVEYEKRIAQYVRPKFAIVHSEYLWNKETGEVRCVESALRGGGVFISSNLIPACTGIDINQILINFALGESIDVKKELSKKEDKAAAYICFYLPQGIVDRIEGADKIKDRSDVDMACLDNIKEGNVAKKMIHKGSRLGPILVHANNRQELLHAISSIQQDFKVFVETTDGIKTQIWE